MNTSMTQPQRFALFRFLVGIVTCGSLASVLPSCAFQADTSSGEERLGQAAEEIIGGTATAARPEVNLWGSDLFGCGATLIAPQYAVSAAHCNYGLPATVRNSTFLGQAVTNVWIFGAGPEVENSYNLNQDVMLLRLASTTGQTPAAISTRWANTGETVTLMGYGPTNAGCSTGGGTKNFLTFNLENPPVNHVCSGDSGGPMFLGNLGANGNLVAVNSSAIAPKRLYGDVVMFREDIAAVMRFWDGGLEIGIDRSGSDLPSMPVASPNAGDCQSKCQNNANCVAFTWVNTQWCYLKSRVEDWTVNTNCTSGLVQQATEKLEANTDRQGGDVGTPIQVTASQCRGFCAAVDYCKAYTHYNGWCYLKANVPAPTNLTGATSGVRVSPTYSSSRAGTSIAELDLDSQLPQACAAQCAGNANCQSYTWRRPLIALKAHCSLYSTNPAPKVPDRMEFATQDKARMFY